MARKTTFRQALLAAASAAVTAGEMSPRDLRRLRLVSIFPSICDRLEDFAVECAIADGLAAAPGEIDWDQLIKFLEELLPLILEFIQALLVIFA